MIKMWFLPFTNLVQRSTEVIIAQYGECSECVKTDEEMNDNSSVSSFFQCEHNLIMEQFKNLTGNVRICDCIVEVVF